jgi:hypothetical protein
VFIARQPLQIALEPKLVAAMDRARGDVPRSLWIARAVERALSTRGRDQAKRLDELERRLERLEERGK